MKIPYGYCHCGCGALAPVIKKTNRARGHVKGEPHEFIHNHHHRSPPFDELVRKGKPDECWVFTGQTNRERYGMYSYRSQNHMAHRFAYEKEIGPIAEGLFVLHTCDNPPCCNPAHLMPGTPLDNVQECIERGRHTVGFPLAKREAIVTDRLAGLSIEETAEKHGVSFGTVQRYVTKYNQKLRIDTDESEQFDTFHGQL